VPTLIHCLFVVENAIFKKNLKQRENKKQRKEHEKK
jgi:hypothetical protein